MAHVNKMFFLIYHVSGSLLLCVYCTCSYLNDDENSIYQAALVHITWSVKDNKVEQAKFVPLSNKGFQVVTRWLTNVLIKLYRSFKRQR